MQADDVASACKKPSISKYPKAFHNKKMREGKIREHRLILVTLGEETHTEEREEKDGQ